MNHEKLLKRINKFIYSCRWRKENMMIFINTFHQNTFMNQYNRLNHENSKLLAAVYIGIIYYEKEKYDSSQRAFCVARYTARLSPTGDN